VSRELSRVRIVVEGGSDGFEVDGFEVGGSREGLEDCAFDGGCDLLDGGGFGAGIRGRGAARYLSLGKISCYR
jgi:hypothetical protein